jgi:methyl-accepting chemotaxis protein
VAVIDALEQQAANIGEVSQAVADIADSTGLLALNAAIEAARAGEHGRGFAVVADEVRTLADTSEGRSREVQGLAAQIVAEVRAVADRVRAASSAATAEAAASRTVSQGLEAVRARLAKLAEGSQIILMAAIEADGAAREAQRGAESVSSAAEEQAAAAAEAQQALQQQSASLEQSARTAEALAAMADRLKAGQADVSASEQLGAAAEQLSATVQELSGAATQILAAVAQISLGAENQAAATQQSTAAMTQIERAAQNTGVEARTALAGIEQAQDELAAARAAIDRLLDGVATSRQDGQAVLDLVDDLAGSGRRLERLVDGIALLAVQTTMLAVSGSVEAARAGAEGEGFAVVSADIRSLARDSADYAERVKDLVRAVQGQVEAVRRELTVVGAMAEAEVQRGAQLLERLGAVDRDAQELRAAGREIAEASDSAILSVAQVLGGIQQVSAMAEEASKVSAQSASAAQQQAQGAEDLAAAVEEIASFAEELRKSAA